MRTLVSGEFEDAARQWDAIAIDHPRDLLALKLAHDVCLHIGNDDIRLPSAQRAVDIEAFAADDPAMAVLLADLSFALEEVGRYDEAEAFGRHALAIDSTDLWARHALAHVYESTGDNQAAHELLIDTSRQWSTQTSLAHHIWWHVGLRLLHHGDVVGSQQVLDDELTATTAFSLSDASSLRWRIELVTGESDSEGWKHQASQWALVNERHACGFLDVHATLAFASAPGPEAQRFFDGLASRKSSSTFNDVTFDQVVMPVMQGLRGFRAGDPQAINLLKSVGPELHRIGGSVVQRDLVTRTSEAV